MWQPSLQDQLSTCDDASYQGKRRRWRRTAEILIREQTRTCSLDGTGVVTVGVLNVLNIEGRVIACMIASDSEKDMQDYALGCDELLMRLVGV